MSDVEQHLNFEAEFGVQSVLGVICSQKKALVGKLMEMKMPGEQFNQFGGNYTDRF